MSQSRVEISRTGRLISRSRRVDSLRLTSQGLSQIIEGYLLSQRLDLSQPQLTYFGSPGVQTILFYLRLSVAWHTRSQSPAVARAHCSEAAGNHIDHHPRPVGAHTTTGPRRAGTPPHTDTDRRTACVSRSARRVPPGGFAGAHFVVSRSGNIHRAAPAALCGHNVACRRA